MFTYEAVEDPEILCAVSCEGTCVLVADVNGPWAVISEGVIAIGKCKRS